MSVRNLKVYHWFYIISAAILEIGIFLNIYSSDNTVDINIHDTYYVIATLYFDILLSICYFLLGMGYWLIQDVFNRKLVRSLTLIHSFILIGSFAAYWLLFCLNDIFDKFAIPIIDINEALWIFFLLIAFVAQPAYILNLLIGIFRKKSAIR